MKKIGISSKNNLQGEYLILNWGTTSSVNFSFNGANSLTFSLPEDYGSSGQVLITDGAGNLTFGTPSASGGNVNTSAGEENKIPYWTGTYSLGNSVIRQGTGGNILFPNGSTSSPALSFYLDETSGIISNNTGEVAIIADNIKSAIFKSTGVQIGDITYTRDIGSSGYLLSTDGSGNTSWVPNSGQQGATGATGVTGPTGSFEGDVIKFLSGTFSGSDMTLGPPLYYDLTFPVTFVDNYIVNIESDTPRDWNISNKSSSGFTIDSNSADVIDDIVYWSATELTNANIGAFIGPTGPTGPSGEAGGTSSLSDVLLIGNTASDSILLLNGTNSSPSLSFIDYQTLGLFYEGPKIGQKETHFYGGVSHEPITRSNSGTYTLDMKASNVWDITLIGDTTLDYTNARPGSYVVKLNQDGTGNWNLNYASGKFIAENGFSPTISLTASSVTLLQLIYIGDKAIVSSIQNLSSI